MKRKLLILLCSLLLVLPLCSTAAQAAVTPAVVRISASEASIDMTSTKTLSLSASVLPSDASQRIVWSSSNRSVAKVSSSGVVTAVSRGTAVITATARGTGVKAVCSVTVTNSSLPTSISLGLSSIQMERFSTRQLTPTVLPGSANQQVKWKSSNRYVVSVDGGLLTAKKAGTAVITCYSAKDSSIKATLTVSVYQKSAPSSIALTPATDVLFVGETLQLNASPSPSTACGYFTWKTSSSRYASVSETGVVTAKRAGWVTITCTSRQNTRVRATRKILVVPVNSPKSLSLGLTSVTMNPGLTRQLSATVTPADKSADVVWKSSRSSVVSVSANGLLTAKKAGTATITCTSRVNSNVRATLTVTVQNLPAPTSLSVSGSRTVARGSTIQLSAVPYPSGTSAEVKWSTSNSRVATVSSSGVVTGVKGGTVTITATSRRNSRVSAQYTVSVSDPDSPTKITLNTGSFTMETGATYHLLASVTPLGADSGVKWTSSNTSVARVSSNGVVTARKNGTAVITVRSSYNSSVSAAVQIRVETKSAPTSISLSAGSTYLSKGDTMVLNVKTTPSTASQLFGFKTSSSSIATVSDEGVVTARRAGTVKITVYSKKKSSVSASITLIVADETTPRALSLPSSEIFLGEGDTVTLTPVISPITASRKVSWTSSNRSVASVSSSGEIKAGGQGSAVITCTTATGGLSASCTVTVYDTTLTRQLPARTTSVSGIAENMAKIEAIRRSAVNQVVLLQKNGAITSAEAALRRDIVNRAFDMQAFPWMTLSTQEYWSKAYAYKRYLPNTVYYGLPYIQTAASGSYQNRRYNVEKALSEGRYYSSGKGYYILNQSKLLEKMYVGCDCSSFASMSMFGTAHAASYLNTTAIVKSAYYNTLPNYANLRPGDILVKGGDHVIVFLYYTNSARTEMMIIEQGGDGSTVICSLYNPSWFSSRGYIARRRTGFKMT